MVGASCFNGRKDIDPCSNERLGDVPPLEDDDAFENATTILYLVLEGVRNAPTALVRVAEAICMP